MNLYFVNSCDIAALAGAFDLRVYLYAVLGYNNDTTLVRLELFLSSYSVSKLTCVNFGFTSYRTSRMWMPRMAPCMEPSAPKRGRLFNFVIASHRCLPHYQHVDQCWIEAELQCCF
jgi:hypothetical protein